MSDEMAKRLKEEMAGMVEALKLSSEKQKIIRLRYGLDGQPAATFKELQKALKMQPKLLKKEIEDADRLVFNYLKNKV